jgi:hypothetical protein
VLALSSILRYNKKRELLCNQCRPSRRFFGASIRRSADLSKRTTIRIISHAKGLLDMVEKITSQLVTRKLELETRNKLTSLDTQLRALEIARGLTSLVEPNDMTGWYCQAYKTLGEGKYTMIAGMARKGRSPKNLFSWLLKQEMSK